jgi:hypothetical protein
MLKHFMKLPLDVSVHIYDHLQAAHEQCFVNSMARSHPDRSSNHTYKPVSPIMFIRRLFHLNDV